MSASEAPAITAVQRRRELPLNYAHHQFRTTFIVVALIACFVAAFVKSDYNLGLVNLSLIYGVVAVGFYFVFSLTGQFAFSQAFMAAIGGYTTAWAMGHVSFLLALVAGAVVAAFVSLAFGLMMRKANELYFAIATLGLSEVGMIVIRHWEGFGGLDGVRIGIDIPTIFGIEIDTQTKTFWLVLVLLAMVLFLGCAMLRSPMARELVTVRDNELVASTLGLPVLNLRLFAFVLAGAVAALGGGVYGVWQGAVATDAFGVNLGIGIFIMVLLGGMNSMWGAVIGAFVYVWLPVEFQRLDEYRDVVFGLMIVLIVVASPGGLVGLIDDLWARLRSGKRRLSADGEVG